MSCPVKAVRICLSAACISFAIAWVTIALFIVRVVPPAEPYSTVGSIVAIGGHFVAFVAITAASIYGVSAFIREPENCGYSDLSLIAGAIVLWGLCVYRIATLPSVVT
jgi:hypothetical protein